MAIVKMKKLSVIGMQDEREAIMRELMDLGVVEFTGTQDKLADEEWVQLVEKDGDEEGTARKEKELARVQQALKALDQYGGEKPAAFRLRKNVTEAQFAEYIADKDRFAKETEEVVNLYNDLNQTQLQENAANAQIFALRPWESYDLPLEMKHTEKLSLLLGVFSPGTNTAEIAESLEADGYPVLLEPVNEDKEQLYARLWCFTEDEPQVMDKLKTYGFAKPSYTDSPGTVTENIEECEAEIKVLQAKKERLLGQIAEKASYREDLEIYHDLMVVDRDQSKIRSSLVTTEKAFEFDGYVPAASMRDVEKILDKYFCNYVFTEPEEDDDVPVRLNLGKFFSPMEFVTKLYSLPNYREVDPTKILSVFYIIFFGIMFGDVGYGILLVLGTTLAMKKFHMVEGNAGKLMKVIFYSGFSSIFWGFMFGSFFGDLIPVIGQTFFDKEITINPLWLDPAKQPMVFLVFSCALGVVHLFIGMGIKAYELIRDGKFLDACNEVFVWYMVVLGLVMWLFGGMVSPGLSPIGKWLAIIGFALAIILPIFVAQGAGKALGVWNIYSGVTGNLSDILSYSRLLGLGLASTSIAQVFNFLASMGGKSVVGVLMFILIFLLGHTLNFAINALGAFVHSCRLQYVEFFGKFFEGEGREFDPFYRNTKYINIIEGGE